VRGLTGTEDVELAPLILGRSECGWLPARNSPRGSDLLAQVPKFDELRLSHSTQDSFASELRSAFNLQRKHCRATRTCRSPRAAETRHLSCSNWRGRHFQTSGEARVSGSGRGNGPEEASHPSEGWYLSARRATFRRVHTRNALVLSRKPAPATLSGPAHGRNRRSGNPDPFHSTPDRPSTRATYLHKPACNCCAKHSVFMRRCLRSRSTSLF
jgi:hypothetical protein